MDIRSDSLQQDAYYVSDTEAGEWLQYTINVKKSGRYVLRFDVATASDSSRLSARVNGVLAGAERALPATGGLKSWRTFDIKNVRLPAGKQTLRIYVHRGGFNLRTVTFLAEQASLNRQRLR